MLGIDGLSEDMNNQTCIQVDKGTYINHVDSWGGGVGQMTILLHKPYLVFKSDHEGGGGVKIPKNWPRVLWMASNHNTVMLQKRFAFVMSPTR